MRGSRPASPHDGSTTASAPPVGDEESPPPAEANRVKPVLALVVLGLMAAAIFGFGKAIGAWDEPAAAGPETALTTAEQPTVPLDGRDDPSAESSGGSQKGADDGGPARESLPASVVRRLDKVCRLAQEDALAIAAQMQPTSREHLRRLFEHLGKLNETYNGAALAVLRRHADDRRVRTLARLFERDERLVDQLVAGIASVDSPAGLARLRGRLQELRRLGARESRVLGALGAHTCETATLG